MSDYAEVVRREFPCCEGFGGFSCGVGVEHVEECPAVYSREAQRVYDAAKREGARAARVATLREVLKAEPMRGTDLWEDDLKRWRAEIEEAERD